MKCKCIHGNKYLTILLLYATFSIPYAIAQDLEPRMLSDMPTGTNVAIASYAYSTGNILLETALPIEDLSSKINSTVFAYACSFKLFNKLTKVDAILPVAFAKFSGLYDSRDSSTSRQGLGDPSFRVSMVLIGADPLKPADFATRELKKFKLGVMARVRFPLGQYNSSKLINLGTNRFSLKLGLAASYSITKKLNWELHLNSWYFSENKSFFNGNRLKQKPMITLQTHFSYVFTPRLWAAVSYGRSNLGETVLNGVEKNDEQKNSRSGVAVAYRLNQKHALKAAFSTGVTTRYGSDYSTFVLAYQFMWLNKKK